MNLYLIEQNENMGYDTYDSAVVCAETEKEAQEMHPGALAYVEYIDSWQDKNLGKFYYYNDWAYPEYVSVTFLGKATLEVKKGVVCSSFNAG